MHIFVVENHPDTLKYLIRYLKRKGHTVSAAESVNEAYQGLLHTDCDVLLTDVGLADGTGWELLEKLGDHRPPVAIAMTGKSGAEDTRRSYRAGFQHHLLKPFAPLDLDLLLEVVEKEKPGTTHGAEPLLGDHPEAGTTETLRTRKI